MVIYDLSLDAINTKSPYKVRKANVGYTLTFLTDYDVEIFVT